MSRIELVNRAIAYMEDHLATVTQPHLNLKSRVTPSVPMSSKEMLRLTNK